MESLALGASVRRGTVSEGRQGKQCRTASKLIRPTHALTGPANGAVEEYKLEIQCSYALGA